MVLKKLPKPPYEGAEKDKETFISLYKTYIHRVGADKLLNWLIKSDFFEAPASTKFHSNVKGGLCHHSLQVFYKLYEDVANAGYLDKLEVEEINSITESLFLVAALHDLCKVDFYKLGKKNVKDDVNNVWKSVPFYTVDEELPFGHGEKSVYIIQSFMNLTREEALAIRWHMGDFTEAYGACGKAFDICPLALYLHIADCKATYLDEMVYDYVDEKWSE